jgi:hypothetical protein
MPMVLSRFNPLPVWGETWLSVSCEFKSVQFNWTKPGNQLHDDWSNTIVGQVEIKPPVDPVTLRRVRERLGLID